MDKEQINYSKPKRHDLLYLNEAGKKLALESKRPSRAEIPMEWIDELILDDIPAIVRRQDSAGGINEFLDVGFSSHRFVSGGRLKASCTIPLSGITKIVEPSEVFELVLSSRRIEKLCQGKPLLALHKSAEKYNIEIGLYGSVALYTLTGKEYVNENSDVDIYIKTDGLESLEAFHADAKALSEKENVSFDIELDIGDGYAVKLEEYLSNQKTALAKGLYDVKLVCTYRK